MSGNVQTRGASRRARRRGKQTGKTWMRTGVIGAGLVIAVIVAWVGWNTWQGTRQADIPRVDVEGVEVGRIAPDFSVPTLDGDTFTLTEHRGQPTIVFFMAYWCGTCIPEARALAKLHLEYGDRVNIIAIDVDSSSTPEALRQFKQAAADGSFTWAFDAGQRVTQSYQVAALDTTLVIDADGYIVYRDGAPTPYGTLKDQLKKLKL